MSFSASSTDFSIISQAYTSNNKILKKFPCSLILLVWNLTNPTGLQRQYKVYISKAPVLKRTDISALNYMWLAPKRPQEHACSAPLNSLLEVYMPVLKCRGFPEIVNLTL